MKTEVGQDGGELLCVWSPSSWPPFLWRRGTRGSGPCFPRLQQEGSAGTVGVLRGGWGRSPCRERLGGSCASLPSVPPKQVASTLSLVLRFLGEWAQQTPMPAESAELLSAATSEEQDRDRRGRECRWIFLFKTCLHWD